MTDPSQHDELKPGQTYVMATFQEYPVAKDDREISYQLYFTTEDIPNGGPIMTPESIEDVIKWNAW